MATKKLDETEESKLALGMSELRSGAGDVAMGVEGAVENAAAPVVEAASDLGNSALKGAEGLVASAANTVSGISNTVSDLGNSAIKGAEGVVASAAGMASGVANTVTGAASMAYGAVASKVDEVIGPSTPIGHGIGEMEAGLGHIGAGVVEGAEGVAASAAGAVSGVANTVTGAAATAYGAVASKVDEAIGPSTPIGHGIDEMRTGLNDIGEGVRAGASQFGRGMLKSLSAKVDSGIATAGSALQGFESGVGQVADFASRTLSSPFFSKGAPNARSVLAAETPQVGGDIHLPQASIPESPAPVRKAELEMDGPS